MLVSGSLLLSCARNTASNTDLHTFLEAVRTERPLREMHAQLVRADVDADLRTVDMPTGHREWITASFPGPLHGLEKTLAKELGQPRGRGFGNEDGWLFPHGALILERLGDHIDLTFSPGNPLDALEDLDQPHLPPRHTNAILRGDFPIGVRNASAEEFPAARAALAGAAPCAADGNYFAVRDADGVTLWRRPLAMWNVEIQQRCAGE
ncbi:MAG: hypothetical protein JOZ54_07905 [Acidobacteria bacterium]|nr:hypothetical protein [Acidobacteriota bacterium]